MLRHIRQNLFRGGILSCFLPLIALMTAAPVMANENDDAERAERAAQVLKEVMSMPDKGIPEELLENAKAIAVIPQVVKGALIVGGSYGKGLVSERTDDGGWSAPSYIDLGGGSFGFQIGAQATDYVLIFTNNDGIKPLLAGKVQLGADASVAAGPVGRTAAAATGDQFKSAIYTYSRSKGAFAGIALKGAVLSIDDSANHTVYGKKVTAQDLLVKQDVKPNSTVQPFVNALDKYAGNADK